MIISFDPSPGSQYVVPTGINPAGAITGWFQQTAMQPPNTGFRRAPNGKFITFDVMNSGQTFPSGINDAGTITGSYATSQYHGFLRRAGKFITFDPTGSQDTHPAAINPAGAVTGYYGDATSDHGFLWSPNNPEE
jgi:hypothetical protein